MTPEQLKLQNQVCFPVYAASRLITREYQPFLDKLDLTYPQYLVLLILWETDEIPISDITHKLLLDTNTVTPLLKRMEAQGLIHRQRSRQDERKVIVRLTEKGKDLQEESASVPVNLISCLLSDNMSVNDLLTLRDRLNALVQTLSVKHQNS